jgi:hypothetical protein
MGPAMCVAARCRRPPWDDLTFLRAAAAADEIRRKAK